MELTNLAAWVGAGTGTAALLWDVFKWTRSGPRVSVTVAGNMRRVNASFWEQRANQERHVCLQVCNDGSTKTTLTHVVAFHYGAAWKRWLRRPPTSRMVVPDPAPGRLPHELGVGERWVGMLDQRELEPLCEHGSVYCGVIHSMAKRPVLARLQLRRRDIDKRS